MYNRNGSDETGKATPWPRCRLRWSLPMLAALLLAVTCWQLPGQALIWRELQNTGHTLLFGVLALLALCSWRTSTPADRRHPLHAYLAAGTLTLLGGIAVEVVQAITGGDADAYDVARDGAGILIALIACAGFDPTVVQPRRVALRVTLPVIAAALAVAGSWPLTSLAWAYHQRAQAFPVIFDPAADWQAPFVKLSHARLERTRDASACAAAPSAAELGKLRLAPVRYAGISIIEPEPDWRDRDILALDLYSVQPVPFDLVLRIHDARHDQAYTDRYNRPLTLAPGANRIRIPLAEVRDAPAGRRMDMAHIAGVILFIPDATGPVTFCTGPLRLE